MADPFDKRRTRTVEDFKKVIEQRLFEINQNIELQKGYSNLNKALAKQNIQILEALGLDVRYLKRTKEAE